MSIVWEYQRKAKAAMRFSHSPCGMAILLGPSSQVFLRELEGEVPKKSVGQAGGGGGVNGVACQLCTFERAANCLTNHLPPRLQRCVLCKTSPNLWSAGLLAPG